MKGAQMVYEIATFRRPSQYNIEDEHEHENKPPEFPAVATATAVPTDRTSVATPHTDIETQPETPAPSNFEIDDEFNLPITIALFILIAYIFSGAIIYCYWEGWDFFVSFYFVFISMSTIGFGDYVPEHPICMMVSIIYLIFGLALMSMCINVVQVKLSDTFRQASTKLGATIGLQVAEEDGSIATMPPPAIEIAEVHTPNTNNSKSA